MKSKSVRKDALVTVSYGKLSRVITNRRLLEILEEHEAYVHKGTIFTPYFVSEIVVV